MLRGAVEEAVAEEALGRWLKPSYLPTKWDTQAVLAKNAAGGDGRRPDHIAPGTPLAFVLGVNGPGLPLARKVFFFQGDGPPRGDWREKFHPAPPGSPEQKHARYLADK